MNQRGFVLPSPTVIVGAAAVAFLVSTLIFAHLYRSTVDDYANFKSAVVAQQEQLAADAEEARLESERISADTARGWAAAVAWHRDHPRVVRVSAACDPAGLRPIPGASSGLAQPHVEEPRFGAYRDVAIEECEARLNAAVDDAVWIETVKQWAAEQRKVTR